MAMLLAAATAWCAALDPYVSLTSQAMIYVLAIVIVAYRLEWQQSAVGAVVAVTALNFFFVPPRWTFEVESREHLIALTVMLLVALVTSHLAASLRRETRHAALSERRARQLQSLATELASATASIDIASLGQAALNAAFAGPNALSVCDDQGKLVFARNPTDTDVLIDSTASRESVQHGLQSCLKEMAVLGPGTGRWPGLDAWFFPLLDQGKALGAACVRPANASDLDGRDHATALCALLAQATRRMHLDKTVQAATLEAQRQHIQSTFLAAVSHDLRTPLAAIVGAASSLQTQADKLSPADQHRLLNSIASEAVYLSNLTENTLQLVRLSASGSLQTALQTDWESPEEIVGSVLARVRQRDPARRIKSKVALGLPLIKADAVMLAQLISNLLDNALAYSDAEIDLSVQSLNQGQLQQLEIAVKDRGPGISSAQQDLIFEPYQRGDQAGSAGPNGSRGSGLGLALCRAIAQAHGGSLVLRRRGGGGSSFVATLPLGEAPALAPPLQALAQELP